MGWKCSATPSTAASAPCRGASWSGPGPRACRTPTCWPWGASELCPTPGWCTAGTRSATRLWRTAQSSPGSSVSPDPSHPDSHQKPACFKAFIAFGPAGCPSLSLRGRPRKRRGQDDRDSPTSSQSESWIERMKVGFYSPEAVFPGGSGLTSHPPALRRTWWVVWRPGARAAGSLTLKSSSSWISSTPSWTGRAPPSTKSLTWASKRVGCAARSLMETFLDR